MEVVRLGSRESRLALVQTRQVQSYIESTHPQLRAEIVAMKTTGDRILDRTLDQVGGKGLFVKELDLALREKRSDLSVHSLKDVPMEVPEDLPLIGFSRREDPRDVLVLPQGAKEADASLPLGCSSRRRVLQLQRLFPGFTVKSIRGNVLTRLEKLDRGEYGGLILAAAGLTRLGLAARISRYFTVEEMIPAAGQGILAIQGRQGEDYEYLQGFFDSQSTCEALCERAFVRTLDGGCSAPIAAHARAEGERLVLTGFYYDEQVKRQVSGRLKGHTEDAERMGIALARQLKEEAAGGRTAPTGQQKEEIVDGRTVPAERDEEEVL